MEAIFSHTVPHYRRNKGKEEEINSREEGINP